MNLKNKRVFISGGSGVIGKYLVEILLQQGAKIFVGDLQPRPEEWPRSVLYRQGDLNTMSLGELSSFSPEYFFHLAATFERSVESYDFYEDNFHNNLRLSNHLMRIAKDIKTLKKVIFASSYLIYNPELYHSSRPSSSPHILSENDPIYPRNLIGSAKLNHEIELRFLEAQKKVHFKVIVARIYRSYGKGSRDVISRWIRELLKGNEISVYNSKNSFDYIYAGDAAMGLSKLATANKTTGVVNLGRGKARSISDVVNILRHQFKDIRLNDMGEDGNEYESSQADMSKFKLITNWVPNTDLEDAIPQIIQYEKNRQEQIKVTSSNVLVMSIGNKIPLIREVRKALVKTYTEGSELYGADTNNKCIGKNFVDHFWHCKSIDVLSAKDVIQFCKLHNIGMIIPTRDQELEYFAKNKDIFMKHGINVMISSPLSVERSVDKLQFYKFCMENNISSVHTSTKIDDLSEEVFVVKERFGAGSRSIGLKLNRHDAQLHAINLNDPIYQPYIYGKEISIDCYIDRNHTLKGIVLRTRDLILDGESQITSTIDNLKLERIIGSCVNAGKFYGHIMFQAIQTDNDYFYLIECNPRFGGASTLSIAAGLDSFYWFMLESMGHNLDLYPFNKRNNLRQIRHKYDMVIEI